MKEMRKLFPLTAFLIIAVIFAGLTACGGGDSDQKTADLVYVNWAEGVAYTHVAQAVLQEKMGYEVTITAADVAPAYAAVAQGDKDAFMETWPALHEDYLSKYAEDYADMGVIYEGTQLGLVVPQYMFDDGVKTVSDLAKPEVVKALDGQITGIDSGAGMMKDTENKIIPGYGLDEAGLELIPSSGPAMTSALKGAIDNNEYIVVTGWKPHWKFGVWDLAILEQDKEQVWGTGDIHITGRATLAEDKPELAQFLQNMYLSDEDMGTLLVAYKDADDTYEMAKAWVEANPDVWQSWIPE